LDTSRFGFTLARFGLLAALLAAEGVRAESPPTAMSATWAQALCDAWNADTGLTAKLVESGWVRNDGARGFNVMQIYRTECVQSPRAELQIALKDEKALCVYGGAARSEKLDSGADYLMWADTPRWREMGAGD
jgi:putative sterol carrier protein